MGTISKFVGWILGWTGDKEEKYYFDKIGDILQQFEVMPLN